MKLIAGILSLVLVLTGCNHSNSELDRAMSLRSRLLSAECCSFDAIITADYSDSVMSFTLSCEFDANGDMSFCVVEPKSICGISGQVSYEGGSFTYDDVVLGFPLLANNQLSPVSAPWIIMNSLRSGYINACTSYESGLQLIIDDSYEDNDLQTEIWTQTEDMPTYADVIYDGQRILSVSIQNFFYL